jgi:uncharacterized iron-regulated protein
VVAEHLPRGRRVQFGSDLAASLTAAGFEPSAWAWPVHEPLFAGVAQAGLLLIGGNIDHDLARRVSREGASALPADLAAVVSAAPLDAAQQTALDEDLVRGHCGQVAASQLEGLRRAQRARDAGMYLALEASAGRPAILVAGNGHVRLDYGVGQLISRQRSTAHVVSLGMLEHGDDPKEGAPRTPYTHLWFTAALERKDECDALRAS